MSDKSDEVKVTSQYYDLGLSSREKIATEILAAILATPQHLTCSRSYYVNMALEYADLLLAKSREVK